MQAVQIQTVNNSLMQTFQAVDDVLIQTFQLTTRWYKLSIEQLCSTDFTAGEQRAYTISTWLTMCWYTLSRQLTTCWHRFLACLGHTETEFPDSLQHAGAKSFHTATNIQRVFIQLPAYREFPFSYQGTNSFHPATSIQFPSSYQRTKSFHPATSVQRVSIQLSAYKELPSSYQRTGTFRFRPAYDIPEHTEFQNS